MNRLKDLPHGGHGETQNRNDPWSPSPLRPPVSSVPSVSSVFIQTKPQARAFPRLRTAVLAVALAISAAAQAQPSSPKPVPRLQLIPLPNAELSFQRDGTELTRYHFATNLNRPFLFPVIGPSGRSLTRLGHPHDPVTHSHHNSVWISHHDVGGLSSWEDAGKLRIVHQTIEDLTDGDASCTAVVLNHWVTESGEIRLLERRRLTVLTLPKDEWLLRIDLQLSARSQPVTLGKTPFGLIGVRMAKTIGVNDGGGTIRNSGGAINEKGVFWKPARWVDYSGPITPRALEGITLFDHPDNPGHPAMFHVRNDGWMGASLTFEGPRVIEPARPLVVSYGLYVHAGQPPLRRLQAQWEKFASERVAPWPAPKK